MRPDPPASTSAPELTPEREITAHFLLVKAAHALEVGSDGLGFDLDITSKTHAHDKIERKRILLLDLHSWSSNKH